MRKIPIKFRGVITGDNFMGNWTICGGLVHDEEVGFRVDGFSVYPESIARLVGYDANSREIYEGDTVECYKNGTLRGTCKFVMGARVDPDSTDVADWRIYDEDLNNPACFEFVLKKEAE